MNTETTGIPGPTAREGVTLTPHQAGMLAFLMSEVAFFGTLIMAYVFFLRQTMASSPSPGEVFSLPLVLAGTACLLSSSLTIHLAEKALHAGQAGRFQALLALTILLGVLFLGGTAYEWKELIQEHGLTISRNMFGTTYFTLVGFHAAHVTIGLITMSIVLGLHGRFTESSPHQASHAATAHGHGSNNEAVQLVSWYWHFVDAVWIIVFTLVYIVGR